MAPLSLPLCRLLCRQFNRILSRNADALLVAVSVTLSVALKGCCRSLLRHFVSCSIGGLVTLLLLCRLLDRFLSTDDAALSVALPVASSPNWRTVAALSVGFTGEKSLLC